MPAYKISNGVLSINVQIVGAVAYEETQELDRTDCNLFRPVTIQLRAVHSYIPDNLRELTKESGVGPRNRWGGLK